MRLAFGGDPATRPPPSHSEGILRQTGAEVTPIAQRVTEPGVGEFVVVPQGELLGPGRGGVRRTQATLPAVGRARWANT